jgi:hypothetical protein
LIGAGIVALHWGHWISVRITSSAGSLLLNLTPLPPYDTSTVGQNEFR